ncbi:MAG: TPM domain-containing protein [candidate division WOR-3 bacterium]|nr:TPM domain-containing protein [candidate division WOR-3 bacterium]MCX7947649.1 TPM domain-containing protein [candidate division WOR-3 bacterium]MDW8150527.1 TPM domain-containing protein [candidate division WOR-3 bacterium]
MLLYFIISQAFPKPIGFVNDYANILNENQKSELENQLVKLEKNTTIELAVAIFDSIGYPIEEYANLLFEKWGIGKKEKDNGILIVLSIKEKSVRIEVGYGLEEIITDGIAGEIIRKSMIPYFKEGNFYLGLKSGIEEISKKVQSNGIESANKEEKPINIFYGLIIMFFVSMFLGYIGIILAIFFFIAFLLSKSLHILLLSLGSFIGAIFGIIFFKNTLVLGRVRSSRYSFGGGFGSSGGFGGFGGGLSGGGGATGKW